MPIRMLRDSRTEKAPFEFAAAGEGADIANDYPALGLTLRRHPLALLRAQLGQWRIRTADDLRRVGRDGQTVCTNGILMHRQQSSTASGVIYATLEGGPAP